MDAAYLKFLKRHWTACCLVFGVAGFLILLALPPPAGLSPVAWRAAAAGFVVAFWWMTEAIPLATTALLPIILFPALGIGSVKDTSVSYAHPLIFLFLGGFLMARAIQRSGLSHRIAFLTIRIAGGRAGMVIAGMMGVSAFLSMWISNTATAMIMMPIAVSVLAGRSGDVDGEDRVAPALMLGVAFAATIGGMASLIGTPPNALFAGFMADQYGVKIGFAEWMLVGLPVVVILLPLTWLLLVKGPAGIGPQNRRLDFGQNRHSLEPISSAEKRVAVIVALTAFLWLSRSLIDSVFPALALSDTTIAIAAAILLFCVPNGDGARRALLTWDDAVKIRWDVLILFGGGLALAAAIGKTGLATWIGGGLAQLGTMPTLAAVLIAAFVIVYLGELASNTAMAAVFLPVAGAAAVAMGESPLLFTLPIALSASIGFMLPVATPPNAIVYGTGHVTAKQMLKAGVILNPIGILVAVGVSMTVGVWVFGAA